MDHSDHEDDPEGDEGGLSSPNHHHNRTSPLSSNNNNNNNPSTINHNEKHHLHIAMADRERHRSTGSVEPEMLSPHRSPLTSPELEVS